MTMKQFKTLTRAMCLVTALAASGVAAAEDPKNPPAGIEKTQTQQDQSTAAALDDQEQRINELEKRLQTMEAAMSGQPPVPADAQNLPAGTEGKQVPGDQTTADRLLDQEEQIEALEERLLAMESAFMSGQFASATSATQAAVAPAAAETGERQATAERAAEKTDAQQAAAGHAAAEAETKQAAAEAPATGPDVFQAGARDTAPVLTGADLASSDFPGSWPMFGTDMRMKLGGYVKADFLYDFDGTRDKYEFLMATIPVEGTPGYGDSGYFSMFARETRFNLDVRRVKPGAVPLRMFVEGDFWSSGNQFRLRHAYFVAGDFLVGQTWTTLSFLESLVFIIDFGAGDALFGGRTTQIRYTRDLGDQWKLAVGLENLDLPGIENPYGFDGKPSQQFPLLAARAQYNWATGVLFLGSSVAQLRWDGGETGPTADALQWDGVFAGRQHLGQDNYVTWNVSYGVGSGENIMAFAGSHANAILTADGQLETMPAFAFVLGFWHKWNDKLSSNLSYAYGWLDTPESRDPYALEDGGIGHLNLIWSAKDHFSTGIEYIWGAQRVTNGEKGTASRVQFMGKFDF